MMGGNIKEIRDILGKAFFSPLVSDLLLSVCIQHDWKTSAA